MQKKILMLVVTVLAVAMLAVPVLAKPTNGPNKVAVTVVMIRNGAPVGEGGDGGGQGIHLEDNVMTGPVLHCHWEQHYFITLTFEDGSTLGGTLVIDRNGIVVPQKQSNRFVTSDYYVFTFPGTDPDTGFEGNGKVQIARGKSLGIGLFHGTGDFEGQTLNVGHGWEAFSSTPNPWIGYWLNCQIYP